MKHICRSIHYTRLAIVCSVSLGRFSQSVFSVPPSSSPRVYVCILVAAVARRLAVRRRRCNRGLLDAVLGQLRRRRCLRVRRAVVEHILADLVI